MNEKLNTEIWAIAREYASISGVMRQDKLISDLVALIERKEKEAFEASRGDVEVLDEHPNYLFAYITSNYPTFEDYKKTSNDKEA